jgi:hypothetical protein
MPKNPDDQRRDAVLKHMLSRPPQPHQTKAQAAKKIRASNNRAKPAKRAG